MIPLELSSEDLIGRLLGLAGTESVAVLDSCGPRGWGPGILVAGIREQGGLVSHESFGTETLSVLEENELEAPALFYTISYEFGHDLLGICRSGPERTKVLGFEPRLRADRFAAVVIHEYGTGQTFIDGEPDAARSLKDSILDTAPLEDSGRPCPGAVVPEFEMSRKDYISNIEAILELIRAGETYQTNFTQKIKVDRTSMDPRRIYRSLRREHPAAFSAFIGRPSGHVVSISPERFFRTRYENGRHRIEASPIKGTRPRSIDPAEDRRLRDELASSAKDRAENIMITDLLRNDLGRVCEFGSVSVDSLCQIEELPSLFHLVSTISGDLREGTRISDLLKALFPCGSITGCPKIRTMEIIDELEPSERGISMGAIGLSFDRRAMPALDRIWNPDPVGTPPKGSRCYDLSVAIRTMVIRGSVAEFNVGGGIVIDSDPSKEYQESLDKAAAILKALGAERSGIERPTSRPAEQST